MKGPYERLKYDLRRVWECPECSHRVRTGGESTSARCDAMRNGSPCDMVMKLVEDGVRLVPHDPPPPREKQEKPSRGRRPERKQPGERKPADSGDRKHDEAKQTAQTARQGSPSDEQANDKPANSNKSSEERGPAADGKTPAADGSQATIESKSITDKPSPDKPSPDNEK